MTKNCSFTGSAELRPILATLRSVQLLSQDVSADAGFLYDKDSTYGKMIKGTMCCAVNTLWTGDANLRF